MSEFKITMARIEAIGRNGKNAQACITFKIDHGSTSFQIPILLSVKEFDDTELVRAARNALYRTFVELAAKSQKWKLTARDLRHLSSISARPKA